jgi:CheY-like chemotaxis protein
MSDAALRLDSKADSVRTLMGLIKVLIVDDEHYTRKVIRTLLVSIGCTKIHEANDGAHGLEAIRAIHPDIVLLDWEMPGIDGATFVRRVRSPGTFPLPNVPIIMLTGHGERSRVLEAVRLGVHEFLLKPVEQRAAGAHPLGAHQAAHDGQARRLLRAGAAQAGELQAGGRRLQSARARSSRPVARLRDIRELIVGA